MNEKEERKAGIMQYLGMGLFITLTAVIALMLAAPFEASDIKAFQNPESLWNPIYFFILIIGFTALILIVLKFGGEKLIYLIMLAAVAVTIYYVVDGLLLYYHVAAIPLHGFGSGLNVGALAITLILTLLLYKYPEWYVINTTGLIIAGGAAAIFGISLIPELVVLLMIILAAYDAISVYKTKHMVSLAESVIDLRVPILFVLPRKRNRDFSTLKGIEMGDAFIMGLGDAVIPAILVVSAYVSYPSVVPALGALAGTLVGYSVLTRFSGKGKPHAGLPFLNTGSITGFLIGLFLMNI